MIRPLALCTALAACASSAAAQPLRDQLNGLVTFGSWGVPLRVGTLAADGSVQPNNRFLGNTANLALAGFLVNWMTASAASAPVASTGGGRSFRFTNGVPVPTDPSPGPIFGERATTLGRGGVLAGVNHTNVRYSRVRGVPFGNVRLTLTPSGGAAATTETINVEAALDYDMAMSAAYVTVGVHDRVDLGVVVPLVQARLRGLSTATVIGGGTGVGSTVLSGTGAAPQLSSTQSIGGRATGIGDAALRAKVNLVDRPAGGFGLLGDARLPTGDEADLLGSGSFSARVLAVYSGRYGALVPHANAGYLYFADRAINDAFLATVGVDADMTSWATVSFSVLGQFHAGASAYQLPPTASSRSVANIPEIRDDALSASLGAKLGIRGTRATLNVLAPFTRGGPRPDLAYTVGLERAF